MPKLLKNRDVEFRNNVIHKGVIPTRKQAIEYGNSVLEIINILKNQLLKKYSQELITCIFQYFHQPTLPEDKVRYTTSTNTIIHLDYVEETNVREDLDYHLDILKKCKFRKVRDQY